MTKYIWTKKVRNLFLNPGKMDWRTLKYDRSKKMYKALHRELGFYCYSSRPDWL